MCALSDSLAPGSCARRVLPLRSQPHLVSLLDVRACRSAALVTLQTRRLTRCAPATRISRSRSVTPATAPELCVFSAFGRLRRKIAPRTSSWGSAAAQAAIGAGGRPHDSSYACHHVVFAAFGKSRRHAVGGLPYGHRRCSDAASTSHWANHSASDECTCKPYGQGHLRGVQVRSDG